MAAAEAGGRHRFDLKQMKIQDMGDKPLKRYLFASDFDQTLSFRDSGYILSELVGISAEEFRRKVTGMAKLNLVQQGAELAYLLLHDPEFRSRVRREHLYEVGKRIILKENIELLYEILDRFNGSGEIETIVRAAAGYGKVAALDELQNALQIGPDHVIYVGDGSSDIHVMLHTNMRDGFTIAVSESRHVAPIAKRTVLGDNALAVLVPILENIVGWEQPRIREFFESYGFLIQEWDRVRTDWLTLRPAGAEWSKRAIIN